MIPHVAGYFIPLSTEVLDLRTLRIAYLAIGVVVH